MCTRLTFPPVKRKSHNNKSCTLCLNMCTTLRSPAMPKRILPTIKMCTRVRSPPGRIHRLPPSFALALSLVRPNFAGETHRLPPSFASVLSYRQVLLRFTAKELRKVHMTSTEGVQVTKKRFASSTSLPLPHFVCRIFLSFTLIFLCLPLP